MKTKKLLALILCLALSFALLTGCQSGEEQEQGQTPGESQDGEPAQDGQEPAGDGQDSQDNEPAARASVRFAVLSGPTGVGAVKLMADSEAGATRNDYEMTVAAANDEVVAKLTSGEVDIAAMATNVAANLYGKTEGKVQMLTLNGLGVLYILERDGETIQSMADLRGRTIYATGQGANPEYVLNYLLRENGLEPGSDVEIVWQTAEEVTANMVSGTAEVCMLPVPAATALQIKGDSSEGAFSVRSALDLTEQWQKVTSDGDLIMSCTVVRADWARENPEAVAAFLEDYEASINFVKDNVDEAAELVAQYGITGNAAIAKRAIPDCNLTFISGSDIQPAIEAYYQVLFDADPASIGAKSAEEGGSIPDEGFYYVP